MILRFSLVPMVSFVLNLKIKAALFFQVFLRQQQGRQRFRVR